MKKVLSLILTLVLLLSVVPFGVVAIASETEYREGHYIYTLSDGEATITDVAQSLVGHVTIPSTLGGYPVVCLSDWVFTGFDTITSATIPDTVKSTGRYVFYHCDNLENIFLGKNLVSIGDYSFTECPSLKSITIAESVSSIGAEVFFGCKGLTNIDVSQENQYFSSVDGVLFDKTKTKLVKYPEGITNATYTVPDGVQTIGCDAFHRCEYLASVTLPSSVINIENSAFAWCYNLATVNVPNSIKEIGDYAFYNCSSLTSINLGNSITRIGNETFNCCVSLKSITIPNTVESIGDGAFSQCKILSNVFYEGNAQSREKITIGKDNEPLEDAEWHYGSKGHGQYTYKTVTTKATLKTAGSIVTKCSVCGSAFKSTPIAKIKTVKIPTKVTYNGKKKTPTVKVKDANGKTISASNYTVTYASGRKNYGKYKVTVTFKGNYKGKKTLTFEIVSKKTTVKKVTAAKKSLKVTIKKQSKATGYQIQYSLNSNFKSAKTKTIKSYKTTSATLKNLEANKKYYVRVRTYKTYKGKKYYSVWSAAKSKKTKK